MALLKTITQDDGINTDYHRILYIDSMINSHISIALVSYVNETSRLSETTENIPYRSAKTYEKEYVENITVSDVYDYLKTLPEFEGSTDV